MTEKSDLCEGGCTCGHVRYQVKSDPMIVHCCHCRGCQKNSGSAFALNALFEADRVELISGSTEDITVPTPSGKGQIITRCSKCKVAVWSNYNMGGLKKHIRFIRVGTLDNPDQFPPGVHIFTESKQPWTVIPEGDPSVGTFYEWAEVWSPGSLERLHVLEDATGIKIT
ncbi:MAG: GFA family protein [Rhodobacteraceae bacterium]|nr:GFA family protein [Paracoccaceae bacterium]